MPAIATYPGTVTPLRGLGSFSESERDVLFGRDRERDELARLVTSEGFRAGLLYGEAGVGKTSLLRAGLLPHLRDHGVVAMVCDDLFHPIDSFARALAHASGLAPGQDEQPVSFLSRVVSQSLEGQLYLFIIDDVDRVLASGDERAVSELGDLFARVVTRSGGRARFLFSCASEHVHLFGLLEKRTGSLFPPSSRYLLPRFAPPEASMVLDRTLALAGVAADPQLAAELIGGLAHSGDILPADLQIAALAVRELGIANPAQARELLPLGQAGAARELERLWMTRAAEAASPASSGQVALRLLAEIATPPLTARTAEWAARHAGIAANRSRPAMAALAEKGLVRQVSAPFPRAGTHDEQTAYEQVAHEPHYELTHEILAARVREVAAPARASARRAFELLGSTAAEGKRLSLGEWRELRRERITPSTPAEQAVIARTKRFYAIIAGAIAAAPIIIIIIIWFALSGSYYMDVARPGDSSTERLVVRAGKPSLSAFFWLPGSPDYGSIVADTGFTRGMLSEDAWERARNNELTGDLDSSDGDDTATTSLAQLKPQLRILIQYASEHDPKQLSALRAAAKSPAAVVELLASLRSVADGSSGEVAFIEQQLKDASPAVRQGALAVAANATRRGSEGYHDTIAEQLASADSELRRVAFSTVQALEPAVARQLFRAALENDPDTNARRELLSVVTSSTTTERPSADTAKSVLANSDVGASTRARARKLLQRAFGTDPQAATEAAAALAADAKAPEEDRVFALTLLYDRAPAKAFDAALPFIKTARRAKSEKIRAAALPLHAKLAPQDAAADLAEMLDDKKLSTPMRVAMTEAWGEIAKSKDRAAQGALEILIKSNSSAIRAAAARAYGNVGRIAQPALIKMVKNEGLKVAVGACIGLANSVEAGASSGEAVSGIVQLWKRKGRSRRRAAEVFARMARTKRGARAAYNYIASASRHKDDPALHIPGVEGVCNALASGEKRAGNDLKRAASDTSVEVRRIVIACVADHAKPGLAAVIAGKLANDPSVDVRTEAARVLASLAIPSGADSGSRKSGKVGRKAARASKAIARSLARMLGDSSRDVRIIALRALSALGDANGKAAPASTVAALTKAFDGADAGEKLELLAAARALSAGDLVPLAIADGSPAVRIAAIDTAIANKTAVASTFNAALTDDDTGVRRAALKRLAEHKDELDPAAVERSLTLAVRDSDPAISQVALQTFARIGSLELVMRTFGESLASRSERERSRVASATIGLVERGDPKGTLELLEPLLHDRSHDVRVAVLKPLAAAYAATNSPEQLAKLLSDSERDAMRRLVAAAAFIMLARTDAGRQAAVTSLAAVTEKGSPLVKLAARIAHGLIKTNADGIAFLSDLVP